MSGLEVVFAVITAGAALIAIGISIASYVNSKRSAQDSKRAAQDSKDAAQASTELLTQQLISNARKDTLEFSYTTSNDKEALRNKLMNAYIERELNTYEVACSNYLDGKIDRDRFKKNYFTEIQKLFENRTTKVLIDRSGRYNVLKKVYDEWFNLEK